MEGATTKRDIRRKEKVAKYTLLGLLSVLDMIYCNLMVIFAHFQIKTLIGEGAKPFSERGGGGAT